MIPNIPNRTFTQLDKTLSVNEKIMAIKIKSNKRYKAYIPGEDYKRMKEMRNCKTLTLKAKSNFLQTFNYY